MKKPLISILTPFKNTARYLPECLESILSQSYEEWELLAVDDHSTDNSREIIEGFSQKDPRIKVFTNQGAGIIEALRLAFSKSRGSLITRMDSDDVMAADKLRDLSAGLLERGRGHVALGQVKYFSDQGISDGYARYERWLNGLTSTGDNYSEIYKECVVPSPCFMVYREDLDLCGAFTPDRYPEDYDLTFRFYKHNLKCIPSGKVLHYWRDYPMRTSRTHVHYANNTFLAIKLKYFLELDYDQERPLTLWGAGDKGKFIAKGLLKSQIPFHWICDNPKKIGCSIYNQEMKDVPFLPSLDRPQSIITVANERSQIEIRDYFKQHHQLPVKDYYFFC